MQEKVILYKDNPDIKGRKVITTISGKREYRCNCRNIKNQFYIINEDCFFVDGIWHRKDNGKIEYDNEKKDWILKGSRDMIEGIVGFDENGIIRGRFSPNPYNNCKAKITNKGTFTVINPDILLENGYFEDISENIFYDRKATGDSTYRQRILVRKVASYANKGYNIEDNEVEFNKKVRLFEAYNNPISKEVRKYARFLGDLTFGVEVECSAGSAGDWIQNRLGLVACRDGSLSQDYSAPEFVSVPMSGAKGLQNLINISRELKKRCEIDINCSYHIHIGNIPTDRAYIVALYSLFLQIQDDLFKMFPYYKTNPQGIKKKNYCKKLKKMSIYPLKDTSKEAYSEYINDVYNKIFVFLSDGCQPGEDVNRKQERHPIHAKYQRESRYYAMNLQNMIFSPRRTAEHRLHTGTLSEVKMTNWLFICTAINKYAEMYTKEIILGERSVTLKDVFNYYKNAFPRSSTASFLSDYLSAYYESQKEIFAKDFKNGDYLSEHDLKKDKGFTFKYGNSVSLF